MTRLSEIKIDARLTKAFGMPPDKIKQLTVATATAMAADLGFALRFECDTGGDLVLRAREIHSDGGLG